MLEAQGQVEAEWGDVACVAHEAEDAGDDARVAPGWLAGTAGQELAEEVEELLALGDRPAEGERPRADVVTEVVGHVGDGFGPFVEGETTGSAILVGHAEDQEGGGDAVANSVENAGSNAEDAIIVDEHRVVVPESSQEGDAGVALVGDCRGEAGYLLGGGWRW